MKNILIPTDFSENSWNAIEYALKLYKKTRCSFHLLHVSSVNTFIGGEVPSIPSSTIVLEKDIKVEIKNKLKALVSKIDRSFLNIKHSFITHAEYGFLIDIIKEKVEKNNIDLIVMGTKGASGIKEVIIGSNTGDVITRVKCPVLVVPEEARFIKPREIAFPTDYNQTYSSKILDTLLNVAGIHESSIRIVHIRKREDGLTEEQEQNKGILHDFFKDHEHSFHSITSNKLEVALQYFTESRNIDMISMVAKNLNFFQQILFKPTVEDISYHIKLPFLVLHE